jgi:hypothetical protein
MRPAKRTIAIVVMTTTLVSCSSRGLPAATPTMTLDPPAIYSTTSTSPLLNDLFNSYFEIPPPSVLPPTNYQGRLDQVYRGDVSYFITNHLPVDTSLWAAPIGQDGIAVIVSPDVNIQSLSLDQLRGIYQGHIDSWSEVGGAYQPITVFSREDGSGIRAEFERMVMGFRPVSRNARIAASSELMIQNILNTHGGIGYVSMGFLQDRMTPIQIETIVPTPNTVAMNLYPLRMTLYIAGLREPEGGIRAFVAWMQGQVGQGEIGRRYAPLFAPDT